MNATHLHLARPREADAERIVAAAEIVRGIDFLDDTPHSIDVDLCAHDASLEIHVHHCSAEELSHARNRWPQAAPWFDGEDTPKYVSYEAGLVTLTFYRR